MTSINLHPVINSFVRNCKHDLQLPSVREEKEWTQIIAQAEEQAFTPLFYRWLCQSGLDSHIPNHLSEQLKERIFGIAARNLMLTKELTTILNALAATGIPCIPVRGPTLAQQLHGDLTLHPMGDLDLLVQHKTLPQVTDTLIHLGYAEMDRRPGFSSTYSYTLKFLKDRHGWVIVEPHWTIAYPPFSTYLNMDGVWTRATPGHMGDIDTWFLGNEDLLLHLCFHIIHREESAPLLWLYELDRFIRINSKLLRWTQIAHHAKESRQALLVVRVLNRLREHFDTPVPDQAFSQLMISQTSRTEGICKESLQKRVVGLFLKDGCVDGRESFALFFSIEGFRPKLQYVMAILFPTAEFMVLQYGVSSRWQLGLSYCNRLGFLACESLKGLVWLLLPTRHSEKAPLK